MTDADISQKLTEAVKAATEKRARLTITGSGSKRFYAGDIEGETLDVTGHRGIVSYEPTAPGRFRPVLPAADMAPASCGA